MNRIKSMFLCSSISLILGAGVAWAVPVSSEIDLARQSLTESLKHLGAASKSNLIEPDDAHIKKATAFMDLAKVELDAVSASRKLSN